MKNLETVVEERSSTRVRSHCSNRRNEPGKIHQQQLKVVSICVDTVGQHDGSQSGIKTIYIYRGMPPGTFRVKP